MTDLLAGLRRSPDPADQRVAGLLSALAAGPRPVPRASEQLAAFIADRSAGGRSADAAPAGEAPAPDTGVVLGRPPQPSRPSPWWRAALTGLLALSSAGVLGAVLVATYPQQGDEVVVRPGRGAVPPTTSAPRDLPPARPAPEDGAPPAGTSDHPHRSRHHRAGTSDGAHPAATGGTATARDHVEPDSTGGGDEDDSERSGTASSDGDGSGSVSERSGTDDGDDATDDSGAGEATDESGAGEATDESGAGEATDDSTSDGAGSGGGGSGDVVDGGSGDTLVEAPGGD